MSSLSVQGVFISTCSELNVLLSFIFEKLKSASALLHCRMISERQKVMYFSNLFPCSSNVVVLFARLHCVSLCLHACVWVISWVHACLSLCLSEPEGWLELAASPSYYRAFDFTGEAKWDRRCKETCEAVKTRVHVMWLSAKWQNSLTNCFSPFLSLCLCVAVSICACSCYLRGYGEEGLSCSGHIANRDADNPVLCLTLETATLRWYLFTVDGSFSSPETKAGLLLLKSVCLWDVGD